MLKLIIGIIIIELLLLVTMKKLQKYTPVLLTVNITTIVIYCIMINIGFVNEHIESVIDKIMILISSISISLLIDTLLVAFIQKCYEHKIINSYEKQYQFENFDYYRDILKEKSPGILCICYNARQVNIKDIMVSILLYLKQIKVIEILKDDIKITGDISKLEPHEKIVLEYLECKYSTKKLKKKLYSALIQDAKNKGYILANKDNRVNMTLFAQMVILIMIILQLITIPLFVNLSKLGFILFFAYFLNFVSIPIYQWIEKKIHFIVRTDSGLELCGKLKGLKHFLKDFSKLNHSKLKQMELYDEYIIYAVLLNLKGPLNKESNQLYDKLIAFPKTKVTTKIKRNNYKIEATKKNLNFSLLFIGAIWLLIIASCILERIYYVMIPLMVPFLVCITILIIQQNKRKIFKIKRNIILENGTKIPGIIVERKQEEHEYTVVIKFQINGRTHQIKTPTLNFSPLDLASDEVEVYYLKGYYYVDCFQMKKG